MKRSSRQLGWQLVLMGALLMLGATTSALAQNTFPASGNVGIGTASPAQPLHIVAGAQAQVRLVAGSVHSRFMSDALSMSMGTLTNHPYVLETNAVERLRISETGNIGIGTISPTSKLHVAGDVRVDGNLAAKYQDVAEWVRTFSPLSPGTVVIIDPDRRNQVAPTSQSYDTRVAGVVSAKPGLLLGEAGEDKVKVAQSGRVKVKVDATYGPITVGDLLVTSATPGYAMRSTPLSLGDTLIHRPGTLLGKALEPLTEGQGEILVLLTIQ